MRNIILTLALFGLATASAGAENFPAMGTEAIGAEAIDTDGSTAALGREHIVDMFKSGQAEESWFSESFLSQIPITEVNTVVGDVLAYAGPFKSLHGTKPRYTADFTKHDFTVTIKFNSAKKIDYLYIKSK